MRARWLGAALALAGLVAVGYALPSQAGGKACDLKQVEKAAWCGTCSKFLDAADVDKAKNVHKGTDHAVTQVDACMKTLVQCKVAACAMTWTKGAATPG